MRMETDEELGSVDWVVVDFPDTANPFDGPMAQELAALEASELVHVLDLMVITKDDSGEIDVVEFEDLDDAGPLAALEGTLADVLALEDVEDVAEGLAAGSAAMVVVWENTWSVPFAVAARESGGQLVASGRIPTQALLALVESEAGSGGEGA